MVYQCKMYITIHCIQNQIQFRVNYDGICVLCYLKDNKLNTIQSSYRSVILRGAGQEKGVEQSATSADYSAAPGSLLLLQKDTL
jgi:hypothetical protein